MAKDETTVVIKDKGTTIKVTDKDPGKATDEAIRIHETVKK